jgi:Tn3 transposase DDE domain
VDGHRRNLVVAAIVLWNTVYSARTVKTLRERGQSNPDNLFAHLSPLGWEHINLTGDYVWKPDSGTKQRPLRQPRLPISADESNP